jgi:dienelactone hydrolase|tara:strand:- start:25683 stop:26459 length:777 start_codon:yes stop_codon:yes gene_type:complete
MKILLLTLVLTFSFWGMSQKLDSVSYEIDGESFTAYYALPKKVNNKTKTILIVHEWWGLNEYPKTRAIQLAKEGMIGFCIDMYGTGKIATGPKEAQTMATPFYQNPEKAYKHFMAGMKEALKIKGVNESKIAAIGYCFGGSMVLNAAKKGAPIDAAISFHGGLAGAPIEPNTKVPAILVCNGAIDKFVPETDIENFKADMEKNKINFLFINYPESTHAFTNPGSTSTGLKFEMPIAYNEAADKKSWKDFKKFVKGNVK